MKRTLIYTCADKEYSHWIPLYCLALLMHNNNIDIEIGMEGVLDKPEEDCINFLKKRFPNAKILIKENFFKRIGSLALCEDGKKCILNSVRFITTPVLKDEYIYIGDIDIICLEENFSQQHTKHMAEIEKPYSNIIRKNNPSHMSGLHFAEYNSFYPLPDISTLNLSGNDEELLKQIVEKKGIVLDLNTEFRPVHGIHFSKNRPTVAGTDKIPGWGALPWKEKWSIFSNTNEYKFVFERLNIFQKNQINKLVEYYNSLNND